MGKLDNISNIQRLSCILIGYIYYGSLQQRTYQDSWISVVCKKYLIKKSRANQLHSIERLAMNYIIDGGGTRTKNLTERNLCCFYQLSYEDRTWSFTALVKLKNISILLVSNRSFAERTL